MPTGLFTYCHFLFFKRLIGSFPAFVYILLLKNSYKYYILLIYLALS